MTMRLHQRKGSPPKGVEDHLGLLSGVKLFESLSPDELQKVANRIPAKDFKVHQHIYTSAYRGDMFFLLLEGRVRIYRLEGGREITICILEAGEMFGEAAFASREVRGSYAQALVPSRVAFSSRALLGRLIHEYPNLGIKAVELLSERISLYEKKIADLGLKQVASRLASTILEMAERDGMVAGERQYRIRTGYTHEELATMIGAQRVAVSRAMGELRRVGAIETKNRYWHVIDAVALAKIAEAA
jgi:CRP/FNR family transcriptional regulator, cyclic AMP receptor protein